MNRAIAIGIAIGVTPLFVLMLDSPVAKFTVEGGEHLRAVAGTISMLGGPGVVLAVLGGLNLLECLKRWQDGGFAAATLRLHTWWPVLFVAVGTTLAALIAKTIVGRARPLVDGLDPLSFAPLSLTEGYGSLPSAQAALVVALAVMLSKRFPKQRIVVWTIATTLCLARIATAEHWVSDVWLGVLLGLGMARMRRLLWA